MHALDRGFGLRVRSLAPYVGGEQSRTYTADLGRERVLVKLHEYESGVYLEATTRLTAWLAKERLEWDVPEPLEASDGTVIAQSEHGPLTVHRFLAGDAVSLDALTDAQVARLGELIANLHQSVPRSLRPPLPDDDVALDAVPRIRALLASVDQLGDAADAIEKRARELLSDARDVLLDSLVEAQTIESRAVRETPRFVVTHGDLTASNILLSSTGRFAVVDWNAALWAPPERDIRFFLGRRFPQFLAGYSAIRDPMLSVPLLHLYVWRWQLDGVAFFGERAVGPVARRSANDLALLQRFVAALSNRPLPEIAAVEEALVRV